MIFLIFLVVYSINIKIMSLFFLFSKVKSISSKFIIEFFLFFSTFFTYNNNLSFFII